MVTPDQTPVENRTTYIGRPIGSGKYGVPSERIRVPQPLADALKPRLIPHWRTITEQVEKLPAEPVSTETSTGDDTPEANESKPYA